MAKIKIPKAFFDSKYGRIVYPWKYRKDKNYKSPFSNSDNTYELTLDNKVKILNFGDDLWKCTGISTDLDLKCPNANLVNIDIKSTTNHPYGFGGYDFVSIKNWTIHGNQIIFCMKPEGKEGGNTFNKWNSTSSYLKNLNLNCTGAKIIISGQNSLENIKITSPDKTLSTLNLSIERCQAMKMIDLSEIELIKFRGLEHFYRVDENIKFKFNPNLRLGLSTLHKWANYDKYSPFKYSPNNLNEEYQTWDKTGKIISLKDICPDIEQNPIMSVKELKQKINEFLLNKVYLKPYAFAMEQAFKQKDEYAPALSEKNTAEYKEWLKQEEIRKAKEAEEHEKQRKIWQEEDKKRQAAEAAAKAEQKRLEKIAYIKRVKNFKEKVKTLPAVQQAYLETIYELNIGPDSALDLIEDKTKLNKLSTEKAIKDYVTKHYQEEVDREIAFWQGNMAREDGCIGACQAGCEASKKAIFETFNKKLKALNNTKVRG